jgi:hypothetical protein
VSIEELPVTLEDAVVSYIRDRKSTATLLQEPSLAGANP